MVPITLVPTTYRLDDLVQLGLQNRPDLVANRAELGAAEAGLRQARLSPLLPRLQVDYLGGGFGGGRNDDITNFKGRGDATVQAYWELSNLGLGYRARVLERTAVADQAAFRITETEAQVGAEVSEAAKVAGARFATLGNAQEAVRQAVEMYRRLSEASFGMATGGAFSALEVLTAVQALNQARVQYLAEVSEFNRAQFRLYAAMGQPPLCALPEAQPTPVEVPTVPAPRGESAPGTGTRRELR